MRTTLAIIAALALVLVGGIAYAHGGWNLQDNSQTTFHEQMENILEEGTYDDLVALREETDYPMMPFVDDEESFTAMQERHETMEQYHEANGYGMHRGFGMMGQRGGCPMWS